MCFIGAKFDLGSFQGTQLVCMPPMHKRIQTWHDFYELLNGTRHSQYEMDSK